MSDTLEQLNADKTHLESEIDNLRSQLNTATDKLRKVNSQIAARKEVTYLGLGELAASVRSGKRDGDIEELVKRTFAIRDHLNVIMEAKRHYETNKLASVDSDDCLEDMKHFTLAVLRELRSLENDGVFGK